jgi:hypothetical protein
MPFRLVRWIVALAMSAVTSGCLLNSVRPITRAPISKPGAAHAIVVIGIGLDAKYPYPKFGLTFPEYSVAQQRITGNCFLYNRIEVSRPADPASVTYQVFEVPANAYVYLDLAAAHLTPSTTERAFIAPPGGVVYFGDYIFTSEGGVRFRRDLDAARNGVRPLLSRVGVLELAETTAAPGAHMLLCTP